MGWMERETAEIGRIDVPAFDKFLITTPALLPLDKQEVFGEHPSTNSPTVIMIIPTMTAAALEAGWGNGEEFYEYLPPIPSSTIMLTAVST